MVALIHLHGVAQSAGGAGDNGDLLYRGRVALAGSHQGVANLVVGDDPLFVVGEDGILLLIAGNDDLDALLQVGLGDLSAAIPYSAQGSFIDDIGQFSAGSAGGHAGDRQKIYIILVLHLFGVDLEDGFAAL